jgi:hypothetical protein
VEAPPVPKAPPVPATVVLPPVEVTPPVPRSPPLSVAPPEPPPLPAEAPTSGSGEASWRITPEPELLSHATSKHTHENANEVLNILAPRILLSDGESPAFLPS